MKVLLHSDKLKEIEKSGVGRAIKHQMKALELNNVEYTTNPKDDYDIIHINTIFFESYMMGLKAKKKGKKVIFHGHSTEEDFRNSFLFSNQVSPLFKTWLKTCYSSADLVLTPTPYSKTLLDSYELEKPVIAISNGIELEFFKKDLELAKKFKEEYKFKDTDKIVMAVGLYIERKGILEFVELAKRLPEYKFIWFGYTNLNTVPSKIREAVETKLPNLYFPGYVYRDVLKGAYSACDLFIFPTHEETEGIVLLEALAVKIPVLIRDIPIYQGWFQDGINVYKASDNDEFHSKIKKIINKELPDLTEEGYKVAEERDIKNIGLELKKIYEDLLNEKVD
jgi:1,2-diacylglycerol-3-alpha-glucose alpha-1,2-glucosyltransferase